MMSTESGRTIPKLLVALGLTVALVMMATPAQAAVGDLTAKAFLTPPELSIPDSVAVSPDGRSVYATAESDDAIYLFSRNTTSGALTAKGCVEDNDTGPGTCVLSTDGLEGPSSVAVSPDGKSVYVTSGFDSAITRFTRNTTSGALKPKGCIDDIQSGDDTCATELDIIGNPRSVAVSPDNKSVYVFAGGDDTVLRFNRNTTSGRLTFKGCVAEANENQPCAQETIGLFGGDFVTVSPDGKSVYTVSDFESAIVRFKRNTTSGAITPAGCVEDNDGGPGCAQSTDGLGGAISIAVSPDNTSVYVASRTDDALVRFDRDTSTGALTPAGCVDDNDTGPEPCTQNMDGLDGAISVAVSPDVGESSVYVAAESDYDIAHLSRDTSTGALTPVGCIDDDFFGDDTCTQSADHLFAPVAVAVSLDGKSVYVAINTESGILVFKRQAAP